MRCAVWQVLPLPFRVLSRFPAHMQSGAREFLPNAAVTRSFLFCLFSALRLWRFGCRYTAGLPVFPALSAICTASAAPALHGRFAAFRLRRLLRLIRRLFFAAQLGLPSSGRPALLRQPDGPLRGGGVRRRVRRHHLGAGEPEAPAQAQALCRYAALPVKKHSAAPAGRFFLFRAVPAR